MSTLNFYQRAIHFRDLSWQDNHFPQHYRAPAGGYLNVCHLVVKKERAQRDSNCTQRAKKVPLLPFRQISPRLKPHLHHGLLNGF